MQDGGLLYEAPSPHLAHEANLLLQSILQYVQQLEDAKVVVLKAAPEGQGGDRVAHRFIQEALGLKGRPGRERCTSGRRLHLLFPSLSKPVPCPSAPTGLIGEGGTEARGLLGHPLLQRLLAHAEVAQGGRGEAPLLAPGFPLERQDHSWGRSGHVGVARVCPGPTFCSPTALAGSSVLLGPSPPGALLTQPRPFWGQASPLRSAHTNLTLPSQTNPAHFDTPFQLGTGPTLCPPALLAYSPLLGSGLGSNFYFAHRDPLSSSGKVLARPYPARSDFVLIPNHPDLPFVPAMALGRPLSVRPCPLPRPLFSSPDPWHRLLSPLAAPSNSLALPCTDCPRPCLPLVLPVSGHCWPSPRRDAVCPLLRLPSERGP